MSESLEIEFKNLLSQQEFKKLVSHFDIKEADFFVQENHYFDTPNFQLKKRKAGLRIRVLPNKAELTLKFPADVGLTEITDLLTLDEAMEHIQTNTIPSIGYVHRKLSSWSISEDDLFLIGSLKTRRAEKHIPQGILALDENWYAQAHDFEMELEVQDAQSGQQDFLQLLELFTIGRKPSLNKIQRMMLASLPKED